MGQIASVYDIMPDDSGADLHAIIENIPNVIPVGVELKEVKIQPVAFGIKKIVAFFVIDDSDDNVGSKLEKGLRSIDSVSEIECTDSTVL
ncbi:MAG: translation elongation factor EF-1beta [archaeon]|nr:translation elongation factor EF-1beta [archaeon]